MIKQTEQMQMNKFQGTKDIRSSYMPGRVHIVMSEGLENLMDEFSFNLYMCKYIYYMCVYVQRWLKGS
jgi:hypothetical protein